MDSNEAKYRYLTKIATNIVNSNEFKNLDNDSKQQVLNRIDYGMGKIGRFFHYTIERETDVSSSITPITTINNLDKVAAVYILSKSDPKDVLSACKTNSKFLQICNDMDVFVHLMRKHYPQYDLTDDPRLQYMTITLGRGTKYYTTVNSDQNPVVDNRGVQLELIEEVNDSVWVDTGRDYHIRDEGNDQPVFFTVLGLPLPIGKVIWLQVKGAEYDTTIYSFFTKEDAIYDFIKYYYADILENIFDNVVDNISREEYTLYSNEIYDNSNFGRRENWETYKPSILNSLTVKEYIRNSIYPSDMTPRGIFDYIMANGFFIINPNDEASSIHIWQFVPVTIRD